MTYDKQKLEELCVKYFGPGHAELSNEEKFLRLKIPLDSGLLGVAREAYRKMSEEERDESLYALLLADQALPEVLAELEKAKQRKE